MPPETPPDTITRQARHQAAQRASRGLKSPGRRPWECPACTGHDRWTDGKGKRHCQTCHPRSRGRGRPSTTSTTSTTSTPPAHHD